MIRKDSTVRRYAASTAGIGESAMMPSEGRLRECDHRIGEFTVREGENFRLDEYEEEMCGRGRG